MSSPAWWHQRRFCLHFYFSRLETFIVHTCSQTLHFPLNRTSALLTLDAADTVTFDDGLISIWRSFASRTSISVSPTNRSWPQLDSNSMCTVTGRRQLRPLLDCFTAPPRPRLSRTECLPAVTGRVSTRDWLCVECVECFMTVWRVSNSHDCGGFKPPPLTAVVTVFFKLSADRLFLKPVTDEPLTASDV